MITAIKDTSDTVLNLNRNYAELFAGCGGMSLGIESEGFKRVFANELSPMPAATYAFNLIHKKEPKESNPEKWFTRLYSPEKNGDYKSDPRQYLNKPITETAFQKLLKFNGDMFVGGISQLNKALCQIPKSSLRRLELDILSGGPPCQSFSLAGQREFNNPRNALPFEFAKCASLLKPKVVLLENVSGILSPFIDKDGQKWYAWYEVAKAFYSKGYIPICTHAEARDYGTPQKRSRFVMIAIRKDLALQATKKLNILSDDLKREWQSTRRALENSINHFENLEPSLKAGPEGFDYLEPDEKWPSRLLL